MNEELRQCLAEALALGRMLLEELQEQPTEASLARIEHLIAERGEVAERARQLFRQDDLEYVRDKLKDLVEQQRALDSQMRRWVDQVRSLADSTHKSRITTDNMRRILGSAPSSRQLDVRR